MKCFLPVINYTGYNKIYLFLCLCFLVLPACKQQEQKGTDAYGEWKVYGGDAGSSRYSSLTQINKDNVSKLQVAWTYHTRETDSTKQAQMQCNPIVVNGKLYATSAALKLFALEAHTGKQVWQFDPFQHTSPVSGQNRGVTYWQEGEDKRILYTAGSYLYALNADTGQPIGSFGDSGRISLHEGLDKDVKGLYVISNTPGIIYKNLLILGTRVSEGPDAAPGHIRAYDVRTGKRAWIFHTIPHPGEPGYETWPQDAWQKVGGANAWSGMSLDEKRGLVFIPTGSAAFDFYGGNRKGQNLYANCILALKAQTGELVWYYQTVHHDLWDRDLPCPPNLVTVTHNGKQIDAIAQVTKSGFVFVLDRETGKPLFPVEERPVPASDLAGEQAWPTQPFPVKPAPFARQTFTEQDVTNISPEAHAYISERLKKTKTGTPFIPPSREGTVIFPGFDGGGEWGGASFDPNSGILYVNANEMAWILTMVDILPESSLVANAAGKNIYARNCASCHGIDRQGAQHSFPSLVSIEKRLSKEEVLERIQKGKGRMPAFSHLSKEQTDALLAYLFNIPDSPKKVKVANTGRSKPAEQNPDIPYTITGYNRFLDKDGYPAVKPPWGTLNAINLNTGEFVWQVPLGEFTELTKKGIPVTGTENYGGPVTTAGELIFIGATKDEMFRAFDKKTGKILWQTKLPAGGYATPCTYEVNGKQYVVIAAGGGKMGTKSGDSYVAFALPD